MKAIKGEYTLEISGRLKKKGERVGFGAGSTHTLTHKKKTQRVHHQHRARTNVI